MAKHLPVTGIERFFDKDEVIVSKTNTKGLITYANQTFLSLSGYDEDEVLGQPHNIIRHPDMPRCIFKLLWETITARRELFAYVMNRTKQGDHYWVLAHVTPSFDADNRIVGYHSNRRVPDRTILDHTVIPLYRALLECERRAVDAPSGIRASIEALQTWLTQKGGNYDQVIFALPHAPQPDRDHAALSRAGRG